MRSSGTIEPGGGQPMRQVARGVDGVVGEDEVGDAPGVEFADEVGRAGDGRAPAHQDAVHVHEIVLICAA